jgi:mannosyltransferase OCH1-like enzyme
VRIPAIIHQIWIQGRDALPQVYKKESATWQTHNPAWTHILWDDTTLQAFLAAEAPMWLPLYERQEEMAAKADIARYALLAARGGMYADIDTECVASLTGIPELRESELLIQKPLHFPLVQVYCNSLIASTPAHPIWEEVRAAIEQNPWSPFVPARTGPMLLWSVVKDHSQRYHDSVCFWNRRQILTSFYLPRAYMRWYSSVHPRMCVLDFNDSLRAALVSELRRPHKFSFHLLAFIATLMKERLARRVEGQKSR